MNILYNTGTSTAFNILDTKDINFLINLSTVSSALNPRITFIKAFSGDRNYIIASLTPNPNISI